MKVYITENFGRAEWQVYVYRDVSDKYYEVLHISPEGYKQWIQCERNVVTDPYHVKPTYLIDINVARLMMKEFTYHGVQMPDQSKVEGMYEAQTQHLRDLQKVLQVCLDKVSQE